MCRWWVVCGLMLVLASGTESGAAAPHGTGPAPKVKSPASITKEQINDATFIGLEKGSGEKGKAHRAGKRSDRPDPLLIKVQVLLDRARFSPGAIDGRDGANLQGALASFAATQNLPATGRLDQELFNKLQATSSEPVVTDYTTTDADVKGPFAPIPRGLEEQAEPQSMGYTNPREMLAERFHMQRDLLSTLNSDKPLDKAGTVILVAAVPPTGEGKIEGHPLAPIVSRVEVDKGSRRVRAFGKDGKLVATYPASVGSDEKPAPTGTYKVTKVAFNPWYTYNPKYKFKGVKARKKFSIRPGPNNPVGLVWIDLSIPSYGIHGTPEPENIGKTESHGCIRLTNWDARDLASHVEKGAKVEFLKE